MKPGLTRLSVDLSPAERDLLERLAKMDDRSKVAVLRSLIRAEARRRVEAGQDLARRAA